MHIMVASPGPLNDQTYKNAYTFSRCSIAEMQTFLAILSQYVTLLNYLCIRFAAIRYANVQGGLKTVHSYLFKLYNSATI